MMPTPSHPAGLPEPVYPPLAHHYHDARPMAAKEQTQVRVLPERTVNLTKEQIGPAHK
jgi:hypothetical protein